MLMTIWLKRKGSRFTQEPFELRLNVVKIKLRFTGKYYLSETD